MKNEKKIKYHQEQLEKANAEKTQTQGLADSFHLIAQGFAEIAEYIESHLPSYEERISGHSNRIAELKGEKPIKP